MAPDDRFTTTPDAAAAYERHRDAAHEPPLGDEYDPDDDRPARSTSRGIVVRDPAEFTRLSGILHPRPGDRTTLNGQPYRYQP